MENSPQFRFSCIDNDSPFKGDGSFPPKQTAVFFVVWKCIFEPKFYIFIETGSDFMQAMPERWTPETYNDFLAELKQDADEAYRLFNE